MCDIDPDRVDPGTADCESEGSLPASPLACPDSFPTSLGLQGVPPSAPPPPGVASAPWAPTHLTSTASSITVMSVLHFAEGLMASSAGGITKLLLRGSHMPSPRV